MNLEKESRPGYLILSMTKITSSSILALGVVLMAAFGGCSTGSNASSRSLEATAFASPTQLTARLLDASTIELNWRNNATEDCAYWVEFTTPGSDYVKLDAVPQNVTTYKHPDLAPETKHVYRILPFFGRPTPAVALTTGKVTEGVTNIDEEGPLPALPGKKDDAPKQSIRHLSTIAAAAPTGLTVTLSSPTSADLRWKDRARDEDGFVVEVAADEKGPYQVCALLDPNTTSFRKAHLPPEFKVYFRVRAFFYGKPSAEATATTPAEPVSKSPAPEAK